MIQLEKNATLIFTDSGGVQKEAYWTQVPCITLRDETEWIETVESGWNVLAGANRRKIMNSINSFNHQNQSADIFGDGKTAKKIIKEIEQY
jgi:UDP-N-acetylglucosamine 2-epimerase